MSKAVFQDIYADIKQAIEQGTCPYQSYLPSENELKELYDCSRATIRRAIASLAAEGYVQAQQGKGVRVIRDLNAEPPRGMDGLETFKELSLRRNFTLVTKTIIFELVVADESISRVTGFPLGSDLTRAKRIRYADGGRLVHQVAVGGGACGEFAQLAASLGCDTFVTADLKYHDFQNAAGLKLNLIDAGHFPTEDVVCGMLVEALHREFPTITVQKSKIHHEIIQYYV